MGNKFGEHIRKKREAMGLSTRKLGEICGLSYSYIAQLERGSDKTGKTIFPTIQTLSKLASGLGVPLSELVLLSDINPKEKENYSQDGTKIFESQENYVILSQEEHEMLNLLQELKREGYSNEVIREWLITLKNSLNNIKLNYKANNEIQVHWVNDSPNQFDTHSNKEKQDKIKKLHKKLNDPNYIPPWERNK